MMRYFLTLSLLISTSLFADEEALNCDASGLYPSEINICYGEAKQKAEDELSKVYEAEKAYFKSGGPCYGSDAEIDCKKALTTLVQSQAAWKNYLNLKCQHLASRFNWKNGKADIPYWAVQSCLIETTNQRIGDLRALSP